MKSPIPYLASLCLIITLLILSADISIGQSDAVGKAESVSQESPGYVKGITSERARSLVGGVLGLISIVIGWRAKSPADQKTNTTRSWSLAALVFAFIAIILSIIHLSANTGGFGTGGGKAGAIVALVLGIIGATLGGMKLRSKSNH